MNKNRSLLISLMVILSGVLAFGYQWGMLKQDYSPILGVFIQQLQPGDQQDMFVVTKVIDGDTIEVNGKTKVRYIGIDTPEIKNPQECFGIEAQNKNRELVLGKQVRLVKDVSETDRYGRWLRYVYIEDQLINQVLVEQGYAYASAYPPDVAFQDHFDQAEAEARTDGRGLWSGC